MEQSEFGGAGGGMYNFGKAKVNYCTAKLLAFFKKGGEKKGYNKRSKSFV